MVRFHDHELGDHEYVLPALPSQNVNWFMTRVALVKHSLVLEKSLSGHHH